MATRIYRLLDGRGFTQNPDGGWEVPRHYKVVGPTTELAVRTAVDSVNGFALPKRGDPHSENLLLRVDEVSADWENQSNDGDVWIVRVVYRSGTIDGISTDDPIEYEWDEASAAEQVAEDKDRKPFVNSAGDPLEGGYSDDDDIIVLNTWRTEPLYDPAAEYLIRYAVNSVAMTLFGQWGIDPYVMKCVSTKPIQRQKAGDTSVRIQRTFHFRPGYRPWEPKAMDVGYQGWFGSPAKKGPFRLENADEDFPDAVLLDGTGKPISSEIKVFDPENKTWETPVANPSVPSWFEIDPSSTSDGKLLIFSRRKTFNFTNLIPPIM